jgi:methanogenic corrinoid protein MtbC1
MTFMNSSEEAFLREKAKRLPPVPRHTIDTLKGRFETLVNLVNEKFEIDARFCGEASMKERAEFQKDAHRHFGEMLLSIYEFQLYDALLGEFSWFISLMRRRNFPRDYFETLLNAWLTAMHGVLAPSVVRDGAQPIEFLLANMDTFFRLPEESFTESGKEQRDFTHLLLDKKRREATEYALSIVRKGALPEEFFDTVLIPSLRYIGTLWQRNEIDVADEHGATEICRYVVFRLCDTIPREKELPCKAFVSCVEGEEHSLAVEMIGAWLEAKGWRVYFSGRSAPRDDIVRSVVRYKPDVIFLSVTALSHLSSTMDLLVTLRKEVPESKIILGGSAAVMTANRWEKTVDFVAEDIQEGHTAALRLLDRHA